MELGKTIVYEKQTADPETGELITTLKKFRLKIDGDNFYMSYIEYMSGFFKLKSAIDIKLLIKFCMGADYNTGKISISPAMRTEFEETLSISSSQISQSINNLKRLKLISGDRGFYLINPSVFWKGQSTVRSEMIKAHHVTFSIDIYEPIITDNTPLSIQPLENTEFI